MVLDLLIILLMAAPPHRVHLAQPCTQPCTLPIACCLLALVTIIIAGIVHGVREPNPATPLLSSR